MKSHQPNIRTERRRTVRPFIAWSSDVAGMAHPSPSPRQAAGGTQSHRPRKGVSTEPKQVESESPTAHQIGVRSRATDRRSAAIRGEHWCRFPWLWSKPVENSPRPVACSCRARSHGRCPADAHRRPCPRSARCTPLSPDGGGPIATAAGASGRCRWPRS